MIGIEDLPVCVIAWTQEGCPACEMFLPKFAAVADRYGACIPSLVVDIGEYPHAAEVYRIVTTPTTFIARYGRRGFRFFGGDVTEADLESLFQSAMVGADCQL